MKKPRICALLVSGVMLLTSCDFLSVLNSYIPSVDTSGSTDSTVGVEIAEGGVETTFAEGLKKAQSAVEATMVQDTMGVSTNISSLKLRTADISYTTSANPSSNEASGSSLSGSCYSRSLDAKDIAIAVNASGLTSEAHSALAASAEFSLGSLAYTVLDADLNGKSVGSNNTTTNYASVTGASYVQGDDVYFDATNNDFRSALQFVLNKRNPEAAAITDNKIKMADALKYVGRPLMQSTDLALYVKDFLSFISAKSDFFGKVFTVTTYEDGKSVLHATIGSTIFKKILANYENYTNGTEYEEAYAKVESRFQNFKLSLAIGLTFTDSAITEIQVNGEGALVTAPVVATTINETGVTTAMTSTHSYEFSGGLTSSFAYGDDVKVTLPTDLDTYVAYAL